MGVMGEMGRGRARGLPARFPQEHKERFRRKVMGWMGEMGRKGNKQQGGAVGEEGAGERRDGWARGFVDGGGGLGFGFDRGREGFFEDGFGLNFFLNAPLAQKTSQKGVSNDANVGEDAEGKED